MSDFNIFMFDVVFSRLQKNRYPLWRIYINRDGIEIPKTSWVYGNIVNPSQFMEDYDH